MYREPDEAVPCESPSDELRFAYLFRADARDLIRVTALKNREL
jgi:hypothetical protein